MRQKHKLTSKRQYKIKNYNDIKKLGISDFKIKKTSYWNYYLKWYENNIENKYAMRAKNEFAKNPNIPNTQKELAEWLAHFDNVEEVGVMNDFFIWNPTLNAFGGQVDNANPNIVEQLRKYLSNWVEWVLFNYGHDILEPQGLMDYYLEIGVIERIPFIGRSNSTQKETLAFSETQDYQIYDFVSGELVEYKNNDISKK